MKKYRKTLLIWSIFALFVVGVWTFFGKVSINRDEKTYSQVLSDIKKGHITNVVVSKQDVTGVYKNGEYFHTISGSNSFFLVQTNP